MNIPTPLSDPSADPAELIRALSRAINAAEHTAAAWAAWARDALALRARMPGLPRYIDPDGAGWMRPPGTRTDYDRMRAEIDQHVAAADHYAAAYDRTAVTLADALGDVMEQTLPNSGADLRPPPAPAPPRRAGVRRERHPDLRPARTAAGGGRAGRGAPGRRRGTPRQRRRAARGRATAARETARAQTRLQWQAQAAQLAADTADRDQARKLDRRRATAAMRAERATARRARWAGAPQHCAPGCPGYALDVLWASVIVAPLVLTWNVQAAYAVTDLGISAGMSWLFPLAIETGAWACAFEIRRRTRAGLPTGQLPIWMWVLAGVAATINLTHGVSTRSLAAGLALGALSVLGVLLHHVRSSLDAAAAGTDPATVRERARAAAGTGGAAGAALGVAPGAVAAGRIAGRPRRCWAWTPHGRPRTATGSASTRTPPAATAESAR